MGHVSFPNFNSITKNMQSKDSAAKLKKNFIIIPLVTFQESLQI